MRKLMNPLEPKRVLLDFPELAPYQEEPKAMHVGAPGKDGYLRLTFELERPISSENRERPISSEKSLKEGIAPRTILRDWARRVPLIVQQALYFDEQLPAMACVYILSSGGPNVDGDRFRQEITLRTGAMAYLSTGASTKLAEMRYNHSALSQHIRLERGAYLEYLPEPVIPCRHTRFAAHTVLEVDATATLCYAEIYTSGRRYYFRKNLEEEALHDGEGERFEYDLLTVGVRGERPDGQRLFTERWTVEPHRCDPRRMGVMGVFEIFANVIVMCPPEDARALYVATEVFHDAERGLAAGVAWLPHEAGIIYKVLGRDTSVVKRVVREFVSKVRMQVKGKPLPEEFSWR